MGDPACWLDRVCDACGQVAEELDEERRCPECLDSPGAASEDPPAGPPPADVEAARRRV